MGGLNGSMQHLLKAFAPQSQTLQLFARTVQTEHYPVRFYLQAASRDFLELQTAENSP
jgi:hypothetical protein